MGEWREMKLKDSDLDSALGLGLAHTSVLERAKAENCRLEQGVSSTRQDYFETFAPSKVAPNWDAFQKLHVDYVKRYVETNDEQPHTFLDVLQPNGVGSIDEKQTIVRLENLTRPIGPVTELFRSFDLVICHKGEQQWHRDPHPNSALKRFASH